MISMDIATMDFWRPGGRYYQIEMRIANNNPVTCINQAVHFVNELMKEFSSEETLLCPYCGRTFSTTNERNGHYAACESRSAWTNAVHLVKFSLKQAERGKTPP